MAHTHCTDVRELRNQCKLVQHILSLKGISKNQISKIKILRNKGKNSFKIKRRKESLINLDNYYVPMDITVRKLEQNIFTVNKMRKTLVF